MNNRFLILFGLFLCLFSTRVIGEEPAFVESRYQLQYSKNFFKSGQPQVKFDNDENLRIAILIENKTDLTLKEILNTIFSISPLDRYRNFFEFTMTENLKQAEALNNEFLTAYDGWGNRLAGGFDISSARVQASLVILKVGDIEFFKTGTKGYSNGKQAVAQPYTILHELGHALGQLGDEYSVQEGEYYQEFEDMTKSVGAQFHQRLTGWRSQTKANLESRSIKILKWQPLIDQEFLPNERIPRAEYQYGGKETGRFLIPSHHCIMNNPEQDSEFCPVCQLQIVEMVCRLTGAEAPWDKLDR